SEPAWPIADVPLAPRRTWSRAGPHERKVRMSSVGSGPRGVPTRKRGASAWLLVALLAGSAVCLQSAWADDAPPPPPSPSPLEILFPPAKELLAPLPPFLRDTDLKVHFRTYFFDRINPDGTQNEAWAFGGWASYKSGWLLDTFAMGATLYGSAPLVAPE